MPSDRAQKFHCETEIPEDLRLGSFANAFRVLEEDGVDVLLDFLLFSATEKRARLVSRVRIRRAFMPVLRDRLEEATGMELICFNDKGQGN